MPFRALYRCQAIDPHHFEGQSPFYVVEMTAEPDPSVAGADRFCAPPPTGTLTMRVDNPALLAVLKVGSDYVLELRPKGGPG